MNDNEKYFVAKVSLDFTDPETGRAKIKKEEKLVKGFSVTDVEAKITKKYEGFPSDWRITAVVESKIDEIFE